MTPTSPSGPPPLPAAPGPRGRWRGRRAIVAAAVALVLVVAGSALAVRWHDGEGATGTAAATRHTSADASHTGEPATPPSPTPTATPSPPTTTPSATTRATAPRPSTATRTSKPSPSTKPPAAPTTKPPPPPPATTTPAREVLRLTNVERAKVGCVALRWNTKLASAAQAHSTDMRDHGYFSHTSLDGRTAFDRIKAAGYSYRQAAENIAAGQPTAAAVVKAWMGSSGHRANILNCGLKDLGVGYARGGSYGHYWTQDFGTP